MFNQENQSEVRSDSEVRKMVLVDYCSAQAVTDKAIGTPIKDNNKEKRKGKECCNFP